MFCAERYKHLISLGVALRFEVNRGEYAARLWPAYIPDGMHYYLCITHSIHGTNNGRRVEGGSWSGFMLLIDVGPVWPRIYLFIYFWRGEWQGSICKWSALITCDGILREF